MDFTRKLLIGNNHTYRAIVQRPTCDYSAAALLNGNNLTRAASKFADMPLFRKQAQMTLRKAAVLIPLCEERNKVSLLFTLRTSAMRTHKGQVSFPGGMQDNKDKSLKCTALRETKEELGIDPKLITIWGQGQPIVARGQTSVVPVIGTLNKRVRLHALRWNPHEVELPFTVPIEQLCQPGAVRYTQFRGCYTTPCYLAGEMRIWGLTALITVAFLKCLLPDNGYQPRIKFITPIRAQRRNQRY